MDVGRITDKINNIIFLEAKFRSWWASTLLSNQLGFFQSLILVNWYYVNNYHYLNRFNELLVCFYKYVLVLNLFSYTAVELSSNFLSFAIYAKLASVSGSDWGTLLYWINFISAVKCSLLNQDCFNEFVRLWKRQEYLQ